MDYDRRGHQSVGAPDQSAELSMASCQTSLNRPKNARTGKVDKYKGDTR